MLDSHGDIGASTDGSDGFFHCDTRYLSHLELRLNGMAPLLLGSNVTDDNSILNVDLTNPDTFVDDQLVLKKDMLHIVRTTFVSSGNIYQRLGMRNHGEEPIDCELSIIFASDFADIFEVRGFHRARRGTTADRCDELRGASSFDTTVLTARQRKLSIDFDPDPTRLGRRQACIGSSSRRRSATSILHRHQLRSARGAEPPSFFKAMSAARRGLKSAARTGGGGGNLERHIQ